MTDIHASPTLPPLSAEQVQVIEPCPPPIGGVRSALSFAADPPPIAVVASTTGCITYCHKGIRHLGRWETVGLIMTMTCSFGTFKVSAGQDSPQKLARNILKSVCKRSHGSPSDA